MWLDQPYDLPDAYFIASDGDTYVGVSDLHVRGAAPRHLFQGFTGVFAPYRRRGIARALKLAGIRYARSTASRPSGRSFGPFRSRGSRSTKRWDFAGASAR
jgi:hypothetical protein